jgi:hypothetical protein
LGDEVQFAPYLRRLSELADTVIMEVNPRIDTDLPTVNASHKIPPVSPYPGARPHALYLRLAPKVPNTQFARPLLSRPHLLQDDHASPLSPRGYLTPLPPRVDAIGAEIDRLVDGEEPRIGLVWNSGSMNTSRAASYAPLDTGV